MPYADPERRKEAKRKSFNARYRNDPAFQASEAEKKAAWLATDHGRELNAEASRRARLKKKLTAEARSRAKRRKRAAPAKAR
jgi:hypothetical protein